MGEVERRAYTENVAAQEAAYWYCRGNGIRADDLDIGQILQVAGPIILRKAARERNAALAEVERLRDRLWRMEDVMRDMVPGAACWCDLSLRAGLGECPKCRAKAALERVGG